MVQGAGQLRRRAAGPRRLNGRTVLPEIVVFMATAIVPVGGCGSGESTDSQSRANLLQLVELKKQYATAHGGQGPKSADELRGWTEQMGPQEREAAGVSDLASLFVSPRDSMPYMIVDAGNAKSSETGDRIAVFEQIGILGRCFVAFESGRIEEMDINERAQMLEEYLEH
jgi:hypothetical protein